MHTMKAVLSMKTLRLFRLDAVEPLRVLFSSQQDHDTQRLYRLYDFSKS